MSWKLKTAPSTEPVTLTEAKLHLKMDDITTDDDLITSLIKAARMACESYCNMGFISQTWEYGLDKFQNIDLNKYPVTAISVQYYDKDNTLQTLASSVYDTDYTNSPIRFRLGYNQTWPDTYKRMNAVIITATVGFTNAAAIPEDIKSAIKLMIGHLYANREAVVVGRIATDLPVGVKFLLDNYRSFVW